MPLVRPAELDLPHQARDRTLARPNHVPTFTSLRVLVRLPVDFLNVRRIHRRCEPLTTGLDHHFRIRTGHTLAQRLQDTLNTLQKYAPHDERSYP